MRWWWRRRSSEKRSFSHGVSQANQASRMHRRIALALGCFLALSTMFCDQLSQLRPQRHQQSSLHWYNLPRFHRCSLLTSNLQHQHPISTSYRIVLHTKTAKNSLRSPLRRSPAKLLSSLVNKYIWSSPGFTLYLVRTLFHLRPLLRISRHFVCILYCYSRIRSPDN